MHLAQLGRANLPKDYLLCRQLNPLHELRNIVIIVLLSGLNFNIIHELEEFLRVLDLHRHLLDVQQRRLLLANDLLQEMVLVNLLLDYVCEVVGRVDGAILGADLANYDCILLLLLSGRRGRLARFGALGQSVAELREQLTPCERVHLHLLINFSLLLLLGGHLHDTERSVIDQGKVQALKLGQCTLRLAFLLLLACLRLAERVTAHVSRAVAPSKHDVLEELLPPSLTRFVQFFFVDDYLDLHEVE